MAEINTQGFVRKHWIFFEIVSRYAFNEPISIKELIKKVKQEESKYFINFNEDEIQEMLRDFEKRNIVHTINDGKDIKIVLTGAARYFNYILALAHANA